MSKTLRRFVDDSRDRLSEAKPSFCHFFLKEFVHGSLSVSLRNDTMRAATNLSLKEQALCGTKVHARPFYSGMARADGESLHKGRWKPYRPMC